MKHLKFLIYLACCLVIFSCADDQLVLEDSTPSQASFEHRSCGMHEHMQTIMSDPIKKLNYEKRLKKFEDFTSTHVGTRALCSEPVVLPMAVHFQNVSNPDNQCLIDLAVSQISILNNDYQGSNSDINNWTNGASSSFPGLSYGEACIEFCLASKGHPSGYGLNDGDLAVTINQTSGDFNASWSGYINIFVQFNTGVLGYSPLGGSGNGDGVVIDASAFGSGSGCGSISPNSPYDLGRTLTHELGHYLLLDHIWGGGCGQDDDVNDTPNSQSPYYGCPNLGESSCSSTDLHMNYMDYTNDACMYMFSAGQATRMEDFVSSNLSNLVANAVNVCGDGDGGGDGDGDSDGEGDGGNTCESPTDAQATNITSSSALIDWSDIPEALKYRVKYREQGTSGWTKKTITISELQLQGLAASTSYQYKVRTKCLDGWKAFSTVQTFVTQSQGGDEEDGCVEVALQITLDNYGSETTWELTDFDGQSLETGGPYQDGADGSLVEESFCLTDGCYVMYVDDSYGDGICCDYGEGSFQIVDQNGVVVAYSDGLFGYYDYVEFCVEDGEVNFKKEKKDIKSKELAKKESRF